MSASTPDEWTEVREINRRHDDGEISLSEWTQQMKLALDRMEGDALLRGVEQTNGRLWGNAEEPDV